MDPSNDANIIDTSHLATLDHIATLEEQVSALKARLDKMANHAMIVAKEIDKDFQEIWSAINDKPMTLTTYSRQSPSIGFISMALSKAQKEMGLANATGSTGRQNSTSLSMGDMLETAMPVLEKHELAVTFDWSYNEHEHEILIIKLCHSSGEWLESGTLLLTEKTMVGEPEFQKRRSGAITYVMKNLFRTKLCIGKE